MARNADSSTLIHSPKDSGLMFVKFTQESQRVRVSTRKHTAIILGILILFPWVLLGIFYFRGNLNFKKLDVPKEQPAAILTGAWGRLECFPLVTAPPRNSLSLDLFPLTDDHWLFKGMSREDVAKTLEDANVDAGLRNKLMATASNVVGVGWKISPDDESILKLSSESRYKIYGVLSKFAENTRQFDPFIFNPARLDLWLQESGLRTETVSTLRGLLYPRGDSVLLADIVTLLRRIPDDGEKLRLLDVLMRRTSYWLKLQVDRPEELVDLVRYWGFPDREMDVEPALRSAVEAKDLAVVGISTLLPSFAKQRLNTYPHLSTDPQEKHRDCHWSSFNFFNDPPTDKFANPETVRTTLLADYQRIDDNDLKLGDIAVLMTDDGRAVHSCVHIASDFYFTKNGPSHISPWIVERMGEIKSAFPGYENLTPFHYRLKANMQGGH